VSKRRKKKMQKLESNEMLWSPIAIINIIKKKKKERQGFEPGSATQLSSTLATALRRTAYKATILQDI
jgi:hypothetical protein